MNAAKMKELFLLREEKRCAEELKSQLLQGIIEATPKDSCTKTETNDMEEKPQEDASPEELNVKLNEARILWKERLREYEATQKIEEERLKQQIEDEEQSLALILACADGIGRHIVAIKQQMHLVPSLASDTRRTLEFSSDLSNQAQLPQHEPLSMYQTVTSTEVPPFMLNR